MNTTIVPEVHFFLSSIVFGAMLCACYDQLRVLRTLVKHSSAVTDAEDILFFLTAGLGFFGLLYIRNEGSMRWFAFFGCALGAVFYLRTFGPLLRKAELFLLRLLLYPLTAFLKALSAFGKKRAEIRKKKRLQKQEKRIKIKEQKAKELEEKRKASGDREHEPEKKKAKKKKRT